MMNSNIPIPENEADRYASLLTYNILDTLPEEEFDRFTRLAAIICESPIALITLLDTNRQWFKSKVGLNVSETHRNISFCQYAIMGNDLFEITDPSKNEVFRNNPLVIGEPHIRFYAGVPLKNLQGYNLGTLCVIDRKPKKLSNEQKEALTILSLQVVEQMEIRKRSSFLEVELIKSVQDKIHALENNLDFYKEALDETAIMAITDEKGIINYVNKKFCEISKYSKEELIGQDHRIINSGYHSKEFFEELWTTIENGGIWRGEIKNMAKDGSFYWVDATIVPFLNKEGKPYKYVAIRQDITQKKENELSLIQYLGWQNAILNGTEYSIISTDADGIIRTFNKGSEKMLGYKMEDFIGKSSPTLIHDLSEVVEKSRQLSIELKKNIAPGFDVFISKARLGEPEVNRWTYIAKNGNKIPVELAVTALSDNQHNIIGYLGIAHDISEQIKNEQAIKLYEDIVNNMKSGLFVFEMTSSDNPLEFRLVSTNPISSIYIGHDVSHLIGKTLKEIFPSPNGVTQIPEILKETIINKKSINIGEFPYGGQRVKPGYFSFTSFPLPGNMVGVTFDNITDRKKIELELIDAKEKAEHSVISKNSFLANMSHEIRTPMNAIIGFTDLLEQTTLDENQKEYVSSVKLAGTGLLSIINDILDFSKIESGKIEIESVPFNLRGSLKNIYNLLNEKAREKNLEYNFFLDASLPDYVIGDTLRLNQILINLIGNAIKFTEEGSITVSAKIIEEDDAHYKMKFIIQDTGIGIPSDKMEIIFERFSQANSETTRKFGGSGLGLSIAKNLVELLGGEIKVKSEVGKGSEFSFDIKYKKTENSTNEKRKETLALNKSFGQVKILLCEDNALNQRLAVKVLSKMGFAVEIADNGIIGIEKLKNGKYDLILMDIQMPVMDGNEATKIIRKDLNLQIPIIAMTAHSLVGEKEKCIEIGMNDYIGKPFKQNDLYQKILNFLPEKKENSNSVSKFIIKKVPEVYSESINLNYLKELSGGDKPFEKEMLELFLNKVPKEIDMLDSAFIDSDSALIKSIAHKLKSSMSIVGLSVLSNYLSDIESDTLNRELCLEKFTFVKYQLNKHYESLQKILINEY